MLRPSSEMLPTQEALLPPVDRSRSVQYRPPKDQKGGDADADDARVGGQDEERLPRLPNCDLPTQQANAHQQQSRLGNEKEGSIGLQDAFLPRQSGHNRSQLSGLDILSLSGQSSSPTKSRRPMRASTEPWRGGEGTLKTCSSLGVRARQSLVVYTG